MTDILVTGSAGFIGFHLSRRLLQRGYSVVGVDNHCPYYDVALKAAREAELARFPSFSSCRVSIETEGALYAIMARHRPRIVLHLAAQAGVRASLDQPRSYLQSNIQGSFELLEAAKAYPPEHMLWASTSSAYGGSGERALCESDDSDHPQSFYAASKKAVELMAHSYAQNYAIPMTVMRFFTAYGPWGRPDMALFKFTKAILEDRPIEIYNHGQMERDFTYIDDLVEAVCRLMLAVPTAEEEGRQPGGRAGAPWRMVNIGRGKKVALMEMIHVLEEALQRRARYDFLPLQKGDVSETWAQVDRLEAITGYRPQTDITQGVQAFVEWYCAHYGHARPPAPQLLRAQA